MSKGKTRTKRGKEGGGDFDAPIVDDGRFSGMHTAPTFRRAKTDSRKVKLDPRFTAVLSDKRFQAAKSELSAFYRVEDEDEDDAEPARPEHGDYDHDSESDGAGSSGSASGSESEPGGDDTADAAARVRKVEKAKQQPTSVVDMEARVEYLNKVARGEISGSGSSNDSSDDSGSDAESGAELDEEVDDDAEDVPMGDATCRLALMNCDWEHIKAVDIMVLCSSFCPGQASVTRVSVYLSQYGREKLEEEASSTSTAGKLGPLSIMQRLGQEVQQQKHKIKAADAGTAKDGRVTERSKPGLIVETVEDGEDGGLAKTNGSGKSPDGFDQEALRAYELQKLKYYFAVVECSTKAAADVIYKEVDGMEFESSRVALDLRFVVCTWDEAPDDRLRLVAGSGGWRQALSKGDDPGENFAAYLASSDGSSSGSSSESEVEVEDVGRSNGRSAGGKAPAKRKSKEKEKEAARVRRLLLGSIGLSDDEAEGNSGEDEEVDAEITYTPGSNSASKAAKLKARLEERQKAKQMESETPWEAFQRKTAEKKQSRRQKKKADSDNRGSEAEEDDLFGAPAKPNKHDDFFAEETGENASDDDMEGGGEAAKRRPAEANESELALLLAGDNDEEDERNFDMRALMREEKVKGKKLRGKRKRKEEARDRAPGQGFNVDVKDDRFAAVLEGDSRFENLHVGGAGADKAEAERGGSRKRSRSAEGALAGQPGAVLRASITEDCLIITKTCDRMQRQCNAGQPCSTCVRLGLACTYSPDLLPLVEAVYHGGSFRAGPATGLVGRLENYFLASYLKDLHGFTPLACESIVVRGMMQAFADRAAAALGACFDEPDVQVVRAYLLLGTLHSMLGNASKAKRYAHFSQTLHAGLAGQMREDSSWLESECALLQTLIQAYGPRLLDSPDAMRKPPDNPEGIDVPQMSLMAQRGHVRSPINALRIMIGLQGFASKALDHRSTCAEVRHSLLLLEHAWDGVLAVITNSGLQDCVAVTAPQCLYHGITLVMQGRLAMGVEHIERGINLAITRPGLVTFTIWWHCLHCAAITMAHLNRVDTYLRLKDVYDRHTHPGTQLPSLADYHADCGSVCGPDQYCQQFRHWLERRLPRDCDGQVHGAVEIGCDAANAAMAPAAAELQDDLGLEEVDVENLLALGEEGRMAAMMAQHANADPRHVLLEVFGAHRGEQLRSVFDI
ncbi:hypothetical protein JKP88DRAFT_349667 [Tribonema minus]|uniref:Uncharacterized protein n=1 Tax=Tribonema minus TaxID=303371 RepID=A0A835YR83_9STRA|nr:hypothetical protein JKP88DRAFT_349667 [Tribonema minus]